MESLAAVATAVQASQKLVAATSHVESILEAASQREEGGLSGLLISFLTLFDVNSTRRLTHDAFAQAATPLGFDTSPEAWAALCDRFGDATSKQGKRRPKSEGDETLDLSLLSAHFQNRYDALLEDVIRRLLKGIIHVNAKAIGLEQRLLLVEEELEQASNATRHTRAN